MEHVIDPKRENDLKLAGIVSLTHSDQTPPRIDIPHEETESPFL